MTSDRGAETEPSTIDMNRWVRQQLARPKPRLRLWPQHDDEATDDSKDGAA
jgi:hypothetical protein